MGTVPDPLRSAKLSLVTLSEEKNGLGELSPKYQQKEATIERNSNGYPFGAKVQPTEEQLFGVNCVAEANVQKTEQSCGYDTSSPTMLSPGSFNRSKEGCLETVNNSKQEASSDCKGQVLVESHSLGQAALKAPAIQETNQVGGELLFSAVDDKASSPSKEGDCVMKNKTHETSSLLPSHPDTSPTTPAVKQIVEEKFAPEKNGSPTSAKELEPVSGLELKSPVCMDAKPKGVKDESSHPSARTVPESLSKSKSENKSQPSLKGETIEEAVPEPSKFRDTGTMTVPATRENISRTCQDAEVQAVASMESKSASTSPSIFAAFLKESMPSEAKQKQDQLHIIYTAAGGKEQSEIVDNFTQKAPSTGIMPEVHIQAPAATKKKLVAQVVKTQDDPSGMMNAVCSASLDKAEHPCPLASGCTQEISVKEMEVQTPGVARYYSGLPQQMADSSVLQKTRPVYQISIHTSNQPLAPSQPVNIETTLPPCSGLPEVKSKHHHIGISVTENQPTSPSCGRQPEEDKVLPTTAGPHSTRTGEQLQIKTISDVDIKPKKEDSFVHPDSKEQKTSKRAAVAVAVVGLQATCPPIAAQKERGNFSATQKETGAIGLESEWSSNSAPDQETKTSERRKDPKLSRTEAPASIQPAASHGGKKKEAKSEAKVHLKQSKHVRDVVWDEQGMTWEVYGASLDPESLGIAIQNHLQRQIREHEKLLKAQNTQTRKSISSDTSSNKKLKGRQHNVFQSMMQNIRRPNCCVRPAASAVSD
ncbi:G protein-regulated inducer of neurite outgrowth 3 [Anolis carolinensis]|uniref:GPRIN family member 3 n=1 Tax=Anolis carolinensis TaxID=28377 RepID=G1KWM0_ANOCA|nr:PREDICTED: G protein-regulated inducer of neurite outgrowth 3 [Anolis carolinensis]XP_008109253.1 PREDICTED: G protein-regulated inducer of neurite outgrowth 3 [Anolis carolinensis]XP_008109254.1 PREDICTED: G protein-regulated inducer of neurite outgrowth 3 [Anolis carolinensis]|eukprot:XP_008109252.1 PREDICTED: G protein-regulated inducer of neurite outgrowth 3 [Anolis carolinensis]